MTETLIVLALLLAGYAVLIVFDYQAELSLKQRRRDDIRRLLSNHLVVVRHTSSFMPTEVVHFRRGCLVGLANAAAACEAISTDEHRALCSEPPGRFVQ